MRRLLRTVSNQTFPACDAQLGGDFAMATDDEGHTTSSGLGGAGLFAFNSQKLRNEYGYESEHALAVVAKTIIGDYYGQSPNYSYYDGCSDGGREAMEVAERYPTDFNGIIAGAPRSSPARSTPSCRPGTTGSTPTPTGTRSSPRRS